MPDESGFGGVCSAALTKAHTGGVNAEGNVTLTSEGFRAAGSIQAVQDSDVVCFECGEEGHEARNCPKKKKKSEGGNRRGDKREAAADGEVLTWSSRATAPTG